MLAARGAIEPEGHLEPECDLLLVTTNPDHVVVLGEALARQAPGLRVAGVDPDRPAPSVPRARLVAVSDEVSCEAVCRLYGGTRESGVPDLQARVVLLASGPSRWTESERRSLAVAEVLDRADPRLVARRLAGILSAAPAAGPEARPASPAAGTASDELLERLDALVGQQQALTRALRRCVTGAGQVWLDALAATLERTRRLVAEASLPERAPAREPRAPGVPATPAPRRSPRTLVVDDDPQIGELAAEMLGLKGIEVEHVRSGREAIERFGGGERWDLVLLDLEMPGLDGLQTFERLREKAPGVPVILVTGSANDPRVDELRRRGLSCVLAKPFRARDLLAEVERLLPDGALRAG